MAFQQFLVSAKMVLYHTQVHIISCFCLFPCSAFSGAPLVIASMNNPLVKVAVDIDKGVSTEDSLQAFLVGDVWSGRLTEPSASLSYYRTDDKSKAAIAFFLF